MNGAIADNIALAALPRFAVTPLEFIERERMLAAAAAAAGGRSCNQGGFARRSRPRACPAATSRRS